MLDFLIRKKLAFAIWSLPDSKNWKGIAQNTSEPGLYSIEEALLRQGFMIGSFDQSDQVRLIKDDLHFDSTNFDLIKEPLCQEDLINYSANAVNTAEVDRPAYLENCKALIEILKKGDLTKVVLSRIKSIPFEASRLGDFYLQLVSDYPQAMVFLYGEGQHLWLGASPEQLINFSDGSFHTMALAGTKKASTNLAWSAKEKDEQAIVSRFISNGLKQLEIKHLQSETEDFKAGDLIHIKTEFSGQTDRLKMAQLIRKLHPTPAVCGIPVDKAKTWIAQNEPHFRYDYTGFFGPVDHHQINLFVNLRSALIHQNTLNLFVGGGITKASNPDDEWIETENKCQTLLLSYNKCGN